jgi:dTDP-4-amino-4,6-dideoxygalactose transaminase
MEVKWVNNKNVDLVNINHNIMKCMETNHMTNGGKNVNELQQDIKKMFHLDQDKEVLMVCNGAMGIYALIGGLNIYMGKELRWAVQSFTFPCSHQNILKNSIVMDIDDNMGPNLVELEEKLDSYDGVLVTNCFGCSTNIERYIEFCNRNNKLLLFDNAATSFTEYNGKNLLNYGVGCMVSLHHTKPIGFGEGGFIVFNKELLQYMKRAICFGYSDTNKVEYSVEAGNYKMSEIACIYIKEYLTNLNSIRSHYSGMIQQFIDKISSVGLDGKIKLLPSYSKYSDGIMACIPIIFPHPVNVDKFLENKIEAKKYYYPLDMNCKKSRTIYENILCLPLNMNTTSDIIDRYIDILSTMVINI